MAKLLSDEDVFGPASGGSGLLSDEDVFGASAAPAPVEKKPSSFVEHIGEFGLDFGKRILGSVASGVASIPLGMEKGLKGAIRGAVTGGAESAMPGSVYSPSIDTDESVFGRETEKEKAGRQLTGERAVSAIPDLPGARALADVGKSARESIHASTSDATQKAVASSQIKGNLFKGEIDFGDDPSVRGFVMQAADVFGSMLPVIATAIATKSPAAGGAVGGAMAAGEGADSARDFVTGKTDAELMAQSPFFASMVKGGATPEEARQLTLDKAVESAALLQGVVASVGDRFTGKLVTGQLDGVLAKAAGKSITGRTAAGAALSSAEEGAQEVTEGVAADLGMAGVVPTKEVGEDSAANLVLGALGGGPAGAARGAVSAFKERGAGAPAPVPAAPPASTPAGIPDPAPTQTAQPAATPSVATSDTAQAEAALLEPKSLTALDRATAIDTEAAGLQQQLAALMADTSPDQDLARQSVATQIADLEQERAAIAATWPAAAKGATTTFSTEAGVRLAGEYALMDADDLITSHTEGLKPNPLYPAELQPRDRSRNASELQVSGIAQKLDPARLGVSADSATGAPIVGADGLVESGNARTIALKRIYQHTNGAGAETEGSKAHEYRQFLADNAAQFGLTPEALAGMNKPVLVRVRSTPVNRAEFARQANASTVQRMSPSEQALTDSRRLQSLDALEPTEDGDFSGSKDFIRQFLGALPITEQSDLIESDGRLSTAGYRRIQNAVLARAYGDSPSLRRMTESMDNNLANVSKALVRVAPTIAAARERMQAGTLHDADIAPDLLSAVEGLSALKEKGWTVAQELAQTDIEGPRYSPEASELLQFLSDNIRSPKRIAEFFQRYYEALEQAGDPTQPSMFGDDGPAPARGALLKTAKGTNPDGNTDQNPERGIAGEGAPAGVQAGGQPQDAQGNQGGNQGNGPARADAAGGQPGAAQSRPAAAPAISPIKIGDAVSWQRGDQQARGVVAQVFPETGRVTVRSPGPAGADGASKDRAYSLRIDAVSRTAPAPAAPTPAPAVPSPQAVKERAAPVSPEEELKGQEADSFRKLQELAAAGLHFDPLGKKDAAPGKVSGIPAYSGNKKSFVQKAGGRLAHWLKNAQGEVLYDAFGGGGGYGLWVVNNAAPNVRSLVINEIDAFRSTKLQWTLEHNGKLEQLFKSPTLAPVIDLMRRLESGGSVVKAASENARAGEMLNSPSAEKATTNLALYREIARLSEALTTEDKIALQAVIDRAYASRSSREGIDTIIAKAVADSREYHAQARAFAQRGGKIHFTVHDGTDASKVPQGSIVLSDPPYLYTTGYKDSGDQALSYIEGPAFFENTKKMLRQSVDLGNTVIYHNSLAALAGMRKGEPFGARKATADSSGVATMLDDFLPFKRSTSAKVEDDFVGVKHGKFTEGSAGGRSGDAWLKSVGARVARIDGTEGWREGQPQFARKNAAGAGAAAGVGAAQAAAELKPAAAKKPSTGAGKATARNSEIALLVKEGGNSTAVLKDIAANSKRPALRLVAKTVLSAGLPFEIRARSDLPKETPARYAASGHYVEFDPAASFDMEQVLLHEAIHAVTSKYIDAFGEATALGKELGEIFRAAQQHAQDTKASFYGLTNTHEFLAEVMTNAEFAQWLSTVPAPSKSDALSRFVKAVAKFFGIADASGAAGQAMSVFERIMLNQASLQAESARKLSLSKDAQVVAEAYGVDTEQGEGEVYFGKADVYLNPEDGTFIVSGAHEFSADHRAATVWAENNGFTDFYAVEQEEEMSPVERAVADAYAKTGDMGVARDLASYELKKAGVKVKWSDILEASRKVGTGSKPAFGEVKEPGNPTQTAAFKKWFASSAVVDANGKPLVVYHGTSADFTVFDLSRQGAANGVMFSQGIYLSADKAYANMMAREGEGANVMPAYVSLQRPKIFQSYQDARKFPAGEWPSLSASGAHDGVIIMDEGVMAEVVAFQPEQVKSATGNIGSFDGANPDIRLKREGGPPATTGRQATPTAQSNERLVATQMLVDGLKANWTRAPEVIVARNMQDPQVPQRVRDYDARLNSQGASGEARGFIYQGKVYLLSDQLKGPEQIAEVLFHEVLGHFGLRGAFGEALTPILQQMGTVRRKDVLAKAREYGLAPKGKSNADAWAAMTDKQRLEAAEEVLAEWAQARPELGYVKRAVAAIRNWLRANVPGFERLKMSDADIVQKFILPARGFVERGAVVGGKGQKQPAFSRAAAAILDWAQREAAPVGAWVRADYKLDSGQPVYQVRDIPADDLYLPELTKDGRLQPEKRRDLDRYTERARAGEKPPAITVIEMEDGRLRVVDGHRRAMAARAAGVPTVRALVSPLLETTEGKREATEEMVKAQPEFSRAGKDQTQTEAFKKWFAGSKVVDAEGRPLVAYHGTDSDFSTFDANKLGAATRATTSVLGFFSTDNENVANLFARDPNGANVMPVYVSIKNPFEIGFQSAKERSAAGFAADPYRVMKGLISEMAGVKWQDVRGKDVLAWKARVIESGHDGIILRRTSQDSDDGETARSVEDPYHDFYIAFEPEQVKSATGNSGAFDRANPDIRFSRAPPPGGTPAPAGPPAPLSRYQQAKARLDALTSPGAIDKFLYEFQDKLIDLKRLRAHIKAIGGTVTDLNDAYQGEELYHKRVAKRTEDFLAQELKPLLAGMRNKGVTLDLMESFLHARHAPEANKELSFRNPNLQMIDAGKAAADTDVRDLELALQRATQSGAALAPIEKALDKAMAERKRWAGAQAFKGTEAERLALSGMSDADAAAVMAALSPQQRADLDALAAQVDAINAKTLTALKDYGLMDAQTLDLWTKTYQHYVPLHRDEAHPDSSSHPIGQGFSVKGDSGKRRAGSNAKVTHILGHIAMQRETALTRGEKNLVGQKLYLMASQNPDPEWWSVDRPPRRKYVDEKTGFTMEGVDPMYKNRPNVVMLRIAGKDAAVVFNERNERAARLAESLKNLDAADMHIVLGLAAKATRWFASVNTQYNPVFGVINFMRDVQAALLGLGSTPLKGKELQVARGMLPALKGIFADQRSVRRGNKSGQAGGAWGKLWHDMQAAGGTTGYRDLYADPQDRARSLEKAMAELERGNTKRFLFGILNLLNDYNETMEGATRLAAYKVALDSGMSTAQAASLAKNLTVNFNRKGRQAREIGALYAFFNAAVQGTARMVDVLKGPTGKKVMAGGVLMGAMNAMIGMAMMGGDDDDDENGWSKIPEFVRERSLIIPLGREDFVAIPLPLGFNVLPNLGRKAVEAMAGLNEGKSKAAELASMIGMVVNAFNPFGAPSEATLAQVSLMMSPTVLDPAVSLLANTDWTGKPIYRADTNSLDPTPGHLRTKDTASTPSKALSRWLNNLSGGTDYQPGVVSWTPDQLDYVVGQLTGGVGRELMKLNQAAVAPFTGEELPAHKIPLLGRVYGNLRGVNAESGRYYENTRLLNKVENELKGRMRDDKDADGYREEEPLTEMVGRGNQVNNQVTKLRKMRERALAEGDAERVKEIEAQVAETMKEFNREVKSARRSQ